MSDVLEQLADVLEARKQADPETSYVASLHAKGLNKILEKVGEECTETLLAAKDAEHSGETRELVCETADLWFHGHALTPGPGPAGCAGRTGPSLRFIRPGRKSLP